MNVWRSLRRSRFDFIAKASEKCKRKLEFDVLFFFFFKIVLERDFILDWGSGKRGYTWTEFPHGKGMYGNEDCEDDKDKDRVHGKQNVLILFS